MSNKIVGAVLARNEAGRYLKRVLENLKGFCDEILVLDDGSSDDTAGLSRDCGAVVIKRKDSNSMWGRETLARTQLWDEAVRLAGSGWIYFADADHITHGDIRVLAKSWSLNAWAFPLYDVWTPDETLYRADSYWQGHKYPRIWMVAPSRTPEGWLPQWPGRGIHSGHIPPNFPIQGAVAPESCYIAHLGYSTPEDRIARHARYLSVGNQLNEFERKHAESILD